MTRKLLLSVATSALLTTSVFANGILTTSIGHNKISIESFQQNGLDIIDLGSLRYIAEITRSGGSISDPMLSIDITDLELSFHIDNQGAFGFGFDEKGKGLTAGEIAAIADVDLETTIVDQFQFMETAVFDVDTATVLGAFEQLNVEDGRVYLQYDGDAGNEAKNGHTYRILRGSNNNPNILGFKYRTGNEHISLDLYSNTLDDNLIDHAEFTHVTPLVPQFKFSCVRKFDGLINFENDRISFVNPAHGERLSWSDSNSSGNTGDSDASQAENDSVINNDRMVFKIENARTNANDGTRWMGGHLSEFRFSASNRDNNFSVPAGEWIITADQFAGAAANGVDTLDTPTNSYQLVSAPFVEHNVADRTPGIAFDDNLTFTITHEDEAIAAGTTTYEINFKKVVTPTPIRPVEFKSVSIDLEGGLAADDEKDRENGDGILVMSVGGDQPVNINDPHNVNARGSHYVINDVDDNSTVIIPQVAGSATMGQDVGEWMDHAYVAQIAGVTQLTGTVITKFFIVNRSCAVATPTFKLIKDGKVTTIKGNSIPVDSQQKVTMATLLASPEAVADGLTEGQYAAEVILGGVAEDFYVYAQSLTSTGATKDLPVYNTSARD